MPAGSRPLPPPAPWRTEAVACLWPCRVPEGARASLPGPLAAHRPRVALGGLILYRSGPVGPYAELLAAPALLCGGRPAGHVAFMAVDSEASVAGGRRNWALPKVPARFDGAPRGVTVRGDGWAVALGIAVRRRELPVAARARCVQVWPDGVARLFTTLARGRARLAAVTLEHEAPGAPAVWLRPGRHAAVVLSGVLDVLAPAG